MENQALMNICPKKSRLCSWVVCVVALAAGSQVSSQAHAALGEDVASVGSDQVRMQAKLQILNRESYAIHELQTPTGAKVREFAGHDGKVFAVSWSGGWRPNLREIMGAHYERFLEGSRARRATRGPVRIVLPDMVIVMTGHQRNFFGQVCLIDLLPSGLRPEDVR
jgi:hypothetical protein